MSHTVPRVNRPFAASAALVAVYGLLHLALAGWSLKGLVVTAIAAGASGIALTSKERALSSYRTTAMVLMNSLVLLTLIEVTAELALWTSRVTDWANPSHEHAQNEEQSDELPEPMMRYEPYVVWKSIQYQSAGLNVDESGRRLVPTTSCGTSAYRIFVLGGSTVWGSGVRDDETLPAMLQAVLGNRPRQLCIYNLGQMGWVTTQRVVDLIRRLQVGDRPDLVLDYDISNDVNVAWSLQAAGSHEGADCIADFLNARSRSTGRNVLQWLSSHSSALALFRVVPQSDQSCYMLSGETGTSLVDPVALSRSILDIYFANYRAVKALAHEFAFDYAFIAGPNPIIDGRTGARADQARRSYVNNFATDRDGQVHTNEFTDAVRLVDSALRSDHGMHDRFVYLGDAFAALDAPMYVDTFGHMTASGHMVIARAIAQRLQLAP